MHGAGLDVSLFVRVGSFVEAPGAAGAAGAGIPEVVMPKRESIRRRKLNGASPCATSLSSPKTSFGWARARTSCATTMAWASAGAVRRSQASAAGSSPTSRPRRRRASAMARERQRAIGSSRQRSIICMHVERMHHVFGHAHLCVCFWVPLGEERGSLWERNVGGSLCGEARSQGVLSVSSARRLRENTRTLRKTCLTTTRPSMRPSRARALTAFLSEALGGVPPSALATRLVGEEACRN